MTPAQIRRGAGLTQRQVAAELGITQTTVSDLEISPSRARWRTLRSYLAAVGATDVTVTAIVEGARVVVNLDTPEREREPRHDRRAPPPVDVLYRPQVDVIHDPNPPAGDPTPDDAEQSQTEVRPAP